CFVIYFVRILFSSNVNFTTDSYPLSLHDALPIWFHPLRPADVPGSVGAIHVVDLCAVDDRGCGHQSDRVGAARHEEADCLFLRRDRKSTRLNSSHVKISYAVFCLKKKKTDFKKCT